MIMLSTGHPSTLGTYRDLCELFFSKDSPQYRFIEQKISESPNGTDEEVIAEESQMMYLLASLK